MDEEVFNISLRKFLKTVGVGSQREIEQAVDKAIGDARIAGTESFPVHALSFRIRAMKPDPHVYAAAAALAGVADGSILFIDDRPDNVAAAKQAGWQAIAFESAGQLRKDLETRGILH